MIHKDATLAEPGPTTGILGKQEQKIALNIHLPSRIWNVFRPGHSGTGLRYITRKQVAQLNHDVSEVALEVRCTKANAPSRDGRCRGYGRCRDTGRSWCGLSSCALNRRLSVESPASDAYDCAIARAFILCYCSCGHYWRVKCLHMSDPIR